MSAQNPSRLLATGLVIYVYLPLVSVLVVSGWALGWRAPVAIAAGTGALLTKAKLDVRRRKAGAKPIAWQLQMLVLLVLGAASGGLLLGTPGTVTGLTLGFMLGLPRVSVRNKDGVLAPIDPADPVQSAQVNKTLAIFMAGVPAVFAVVFVVGLLIERFA